MKPKIEWHIEKFTRPYGGRGAWGPWDGPFKTVKLARDAFDAGFRNKGRERAQVFRIVKVTTAVVPFIFKEIDHDT